ncbi:hypothetical protein KNT87_gp136 [Erwinia phage Cronus]|uniref:Uncharacterized protein n=1 Tax=Erwinia phage Cronus TaxID=2163633 RepID=A0A2S1GM65_9CAUD|nr:hypothetical protein KNT87_gp136 [Erwinia phage Cronus]AWD90433.1 hypothetical protein [Erwinia phage Cronus]
MNTFKALFHLCMTAVWVVFGAFLSLGVPSNDNVITLMAISFALNALVGLIEIIFRNHK